MQDGLNSKYEALKDYFNALPGAAIAFSGGVDSTFLLYAAHEALGRKVLAVTADNGAIPESELAMAKDFCHRHGIEHVIVATRVLDLSEIARNPRNRCYLCKKYIFGKFIKEAGARGYNILCEGSNTDDQGVYRPGLLALEELKVLSPLKELDFSKEEIREMSRRLLLDTYDKPSYPCLFTRFPYGEEINDEKLSRVAKAEEKLKEMGFRNFRVRSHGDLARIELQPAEFEEFMKQDTRTAVYDYLIQTGFDYVSLDIMGFRSGSMDEAMFRKTDE